MCTLPDTRREREDVHPYCVSIYDSDRAMYNITLAWRIENPLVVESIRKFDIDLDCTFSKHQEDTIEPEVYIESEIAPLVDRYAHNCFSANIQGQQMEFKRTFLSFPAEVKRDCEIVVS